MSLISAKETKPEIAVRSFLFKQGFRFRKNVSSLPGKPDIVLPKYHTIIFIHGCFWHGHVNCKKASIPSTNVDFWQNKIQNNISRDKKVKNQLKKSDWKIITVWECELKSKQKFERAMKKILLRLNNSKL
jgi:DNA mismatch endonuclease (patch repair protein)